MSDTKLMDVEGLIARWRKEAESFDCCMSDGTGGALEACADELEAALAQQPAAVDGAALTDADLDALRVLRKRSWNTAEWYAKSNDDAQAAGARAGFDALNKVIQAQQGGRSDD